MNIVQTIAIVVPWAVWLAYWIATSQGVKTTVRKEASRSRTLQSIPLIVGGALIILPDPSWQALVPDWQRFGLQAQCGRGAGGRPAVLGGRGCTSARTGACRSR